MEKMERTLDKLYELAVQGELKKDDLKDVENLFGNAWENDKIEVFSYGDAEEFYTKNLDEGLKDNCDYGIFYSFWADVEPTVENGFKIEFWGGYPGESKLVLDNSDKCSYDITDEVKNELKKMGLDRDKSVDDLSLRCALERAAINLIQEQEIAYLQDQC